MQVRIGDVALSISKVEDIITPLAKLWNDQERTAAVAKRISTIFQQNFLNHEYIPFLLFLPLY